MESSSSGSSKRSTKPESHDSDDGKWDNSQNMEVVNGKRMKKDDSGINVIAESDISDGSSDCASSSNNNLNPLQDKSKSPSDESERGSADSGNLELSSPAELDQAANAESVANTDSDGRLKLSSTTTNSSEEDSDDDDIDKVKPPSKETKNYDPTPDTPRPKHKWLVSRVVTDRQYGYSSKYSPDLFRYNCYGSLHMVERLELMYKMKKHDGCVNALNFNSTGTRLVSGSDDLHVIVWDWIVSEPILEYMSGHQTNVFQAKYIPMCNDSLIVTCARDGQIRLGEVSCQHLPVSTRKLAQHKGSAHKLAIQMDSSHFFLTCGEDAAVYGIDLRQDKPNRLILCKHKEKKVPLYSIFINPQKSYEFSVCGRSQYVKLYDSRFLSQSDAAVKDFCPKHLVSDGRLNVTSIVYNYNGTEILASYNDEDIYTFNTHETDTFKYVHRYKGHRNYQTVKGVNYFGPKSEFIMSGSDCGCIFFWEKESEHVVKYMYGDEGGAVNCLEPNPTMPVLATSGLDDDIKIWVPSCENPPDLTELKNQLIRNMKQREQEAGRGDYPDDFVDQTIWFLMQHLARSRRRPADTHEMDDSDSTTSSDEMDDSGASAAQCSQS